MFGDQSRTIQHLQVQPNLTGSNHRSNMSVNPWWWHTSLFYISSKYLKTRTGQNLHKGNQSSQTNRTSCWHSLRESTSLNVWHACEWLCDVLLKLLILKPGDREISHTWQQYSLCMYATPSHDVMWCDGMDPAIKCSSVWSSHHTYMLGEAPNIVSTVCTVHLKLFELQSHIFFKPTHEDKVLLLKCSTVLTCIRLCKASTSDGVQTFYPRTHLLQVSGGVWELNFSHNIHTQFLTQHSKLMLVHMCTATTFFKDSMQPQCTSCTRNSYPGQDIRFAT